MPVDPKLQALADGPLIRAIKPGKVPTGGGGQKRGHVLPPGGGPEGETCGTCKHLVRRQFAKTYMKCGRNRQNWTHGGASDIRAKDPACGAWEKPDV